MKNLIWLHRVQINFHHQVKIVMMMYLDVPRNNLIKINYLWLKIYINKGQIPKYNLVYYYHQLKGFKHKSKENFILKDQKCMIWIII